MSADNIRWMRLALTLGARGQGRVWPNPAVGCVLVRKGRVIARGWTQPGGRPHAEAHALSQIDAAGAAGATAYVTLEPCAHIGQTPPCAQALIDAQVARVVVATGDPDPRVAGRGIAMLQTAGVEVVQGVLRSEADAAHIGFFTRLRENRPFVTLKLASSFDGRIATASGESQWITGVEARRHVHAMRARHDAVWVGAGTARTDLPALTVRGMGHWNAPVRIVSSAHLELPRYGPLIEPSAPVWLIHGTDAPQDAIRFWSKHAKLIELPDAYDIDAVLHAMAARGLTRVFCEGGGTLAASLLKADAIDALVGFTAGLTLGADGLPSVGPLHLDHLQDHPRFDLADVRRIGPDIMHIWHRKPARQTP